jgi:hypothetical protein
VTAFELLVRERGSGEWQRVDVVPHKVNALTWAGKHSLAGLHSATQYEASVKTQNADGWGRHSHKPFNFATYGAGQFMHPIGWDSLTEMLSW